MEKKIKSLGVRLNELQTAIKALSYSYNEYVKSGEDFHLLSVQTQLRALVAKGKNPSSKPLLLDLMQKVGRQIYVYSYKYDDQRTADNTIIEISFETSWRSIPSGRFNTLYKFEDWMVEPFFCGPNTRRYVNRNEILKEISDSHAAHYDLDIKSIFEDLSNWKLAGFENKYGKPFNPNGWQIFIIDICLATAYVGNRFLAEIFRDRDRVIKLEKEYSESMLSGFGVGSIVIEGTFL